MVSILFTYTGKAAETVNRIEEGRSNIVLERVYKHSLGWYWFINKRGYMHVLKPLKVKYMDKVHYEIIDYRLTKDNLLEESKRFGKFETMQECLKEMEAL